MTKMMTGGQMQSHLLKKPQVGSDMIKPVTPRHFVWLLMYMNHIKPCLIS